VLVGDYLLFWDFVPYGIIFMSVCVFTTFDILVILDGQFTGVIT
jgi:hypothetical protein